MFFPVKLHLRRRLLLVCALLGFSAACEAQVPDLAMEWYVEIGNGSDSSPAIGGDGTIYFGDGDGTLWALNPNGTRKWVFKTGVEIRCSPAIDGDGTIYFGCRDRRLYALRSDGRKKWDFKTGGWIDSSPALAGDGTICFGSWDKHFCALRPDGSSKWRFETGGPIVSSAAIDARGRIYFGSHDGRLYALEPDGKKAWDFATGGPIISSPALDNDGGCYFTSVDGFFYALNPDGSLRWRLKTGGISDSSPVIDTTGVLLVGVNEKLLAISADGKKQWERKTTPGQWDFLAGSPVVLSDGSFCFIGGNEVLSVWDSNQQSKGNFYLAAHNHYSSPAVGPGGTIYASGTWTNFVALRGTMPLAQSPWPKFRHDPRNTGSMK